MNYMKQLTISFYDHFIHFCPAEERGMISVPSSFEEMDDADLNLCFDRLKQNIDVWVWNTHDFKEIANHISQHYTFVKAAGGMVRSTQNEYLLIRREGRWDLPKGMVEPGESLAQAALREVHEETGLDNLTLGPLMLKTYHIYDKYGGWHLKQTSWFQMSASSQGSTCPQEEEGISEAVWVSEETCLRRLEGSFASLQLIARQIKNQKIR